MDESALRGRRQTKSGKNEVAADYSWLAGTYDSCTRTTISANEGYVPPRGIVEEAPCKPGENLTIAILSGAAESRSRIYQAIYTNPGVPCLALNLTDAECPNTLAINSPIYGNRTSTVRYEMEGVGSYAPQQADVMDFVTDHYQYIKVVDGKYEWIDSFYDDSLQSDSDILKCFRLRDEQLACDGQFNDLSIADLSDVVPFIRGKHFQNLGSWLWEESETE